MKITSIKQQAKNPERVSVFVDGKYSFSLSLDELVTQKIKKDEELSKADVKRLKKISADGKLRGRALEWLLNRPHSTREFKDYMYRKKAEEDLTQQLIDEFSERGYLDNAKFASWFVELQARRAKSNPAIKAELFKKGISREVVEQVIEQSEDDETKRLQALISKKIKSSRYKNDKTKLMQYLTSQGFSYSQVKEALNPGEPEN